MKLPVWMAVLALFGLGGVYGWQAGQERPQSCREATERIVTIKEVYRLEAQRAQYVVTTPEECSILVTLSRFPVHQMGDSLQLTGEAQPLLALPAELSGYGEYLARKGIGATMRFPKVEEIDSPFPTSPRLRGAGVRGRTLISQRIQKIFPEPEASLVLAMVLNEAGTIPDRVTEQFRRTGVTHIVSISGLHVSIITGALVALALLLPLSPWPRSLLILIVLWSYIVFIGLPVAAVRAAWFWTLALVALRVRRLVSLPTVVILTALILVSGRPLVLQDISFQLSFAGIVGIWLALFLFPRLARGWWRSLFVSSVGATVVTTPIVAYHFGLISVVSVVANVLIVPPVTAFLIIAMIGLGLSFVFFPFGLLASFLIHLLWRWMDMVSAYLAGWGWSARSEAYLPGWGVAFMYCCLVVFSMFWIRLRQRSWREVWE